jgi:hypothetical protein
MSASCTSKPSARSRSTAAPVRLVPGAGRARRVESNDRFTNTPAWPDHALEARWRHGLRDDLRNGRTRVPVNRGGGLADCSTSKDVERPPRPDQVLAEKSLLSAPSRALLTPAEMLVVERKRVPYFAAGSGGMQQPNGLSAGGVRLLPLRGSSSGSTAAQRSSYGPVGAERIHRTVLWARCQIWALRAAELGQLGPGRRSRASQVGRSRKPRPRSRRQGGLGWPRTPRTPRRSACAGRFRSRGDGVVDEDCCDGGGGGEG